MAAHPSHTEPNAIVAATPGFAGDVAPGWVGSRVDRGLEGTSTCNTTQSTSFGPSDPGASGVLSTAECLMLRSEIHSQALDTAVEQTDAMCHAICDALLSAAGLGDIGSKFGTDDPRFAGAHGDVFIRETVALVEGAGFAVTNVAVQLIANGPRLGARRSELEAHLTALVGAPVSVSATTSDGLGFTGKGEGVAVIATALVAG